MYKYKMRSLEGRKKERNDRRFRPLLKKDGECIKDFIDGRQCSRGRTFAVLVVVVVVGGYTQ